MIPTVRACLRHRLRGPLQRSTAFMPQDSLRVSYSHAETSSLSPWRDAALQLLANTGLLFDRAHLLAEIPLDSPQRLAPPPERQDRAMLGVLQP